MKHETVSTFHVSFQFRSTMVTKPRICFLAYRQIRQKSLPILREYEARADIEVVEASFEEAVQLARSRVELDLVDVFVSAGSNASLLRHNVSAPVATIVLSGFDILQAVIEARGATDQVGVVTYGHTLPELDSVKHLLNINIRQYAYQTPSEVTDCIWRLRDQGIGVVVGSSLVVDNAEKAGLQGLLAYSSASIRKGFDDALELARVSRLEAGRYEQLNSVLRHLQDPVLAVDLEETIIAINPAMHELLGISVLAPVTRQPLTTLTSEVSMRAVLESGRADQGSVLRIHGRDCVVNRTPILEQGQMTGAALTLYDAAKIHEADNNLRIQRRSRDNPARHRFDDLSGDSAAFVEAISLARRYAQTDFGILIKGESGTGKELFAQAIHNAGTRARKPFVAINCAAFPESLLESELFGYEEGAFTGSRRGGKRGLFEAAHTGTLFLDEIGDMPLTLQTRLLRALQERQITRLGSTTAIPIDVRVIAATHRAVEEMVAAGTFRQDLYYRINALPLQLPPLRDRASDVLVLAERLLTQSAKSLDVEEKTIEQVIPLMSSHLMTYPWPGNVRELENVCDRLAVSLLGKRGSSLQTQDFQGMCPELFRQVAENPLPAEHRPLQTAPNTSGKLRRRVTSERRTAALEALEKHHGQVNLAADELGISRITLWRWSRVST